MANLPPKYRWAIFGCIALLALCVRLPQLGSRPMHTDETVNAYIVGQLLAGEPYHYDPQDRHGPALSEIALPLARLQGAHTFASLTESELRLVTVLGGSLMILLFGLGVEFFGFPACLAAALLFAFGPMPVYYSRYFIHETFFVAATLGLLLALLWRRSWAAAIFTGLSAAFMVACKETAALHFAALGAAFLACHFARPAPKVPGEISPLRFWLAAGGMFLISGILLFTWFGRDWRALTDLLHAGPHLAARAGGEGHAKPFWYYLVLLANGGGRFVLFFAVIGILLQLVVKGVSRAWLFLGVYALLIIGIYSAIPYKTPWLGLNLWLPLALFVGSGMELLRARMKPFPYRHLFWPFVLICGASLAMDTCTRVFRNPIGEKNPYAYAHTIDDLLGLPARIAEVTQARHLANPRIAVVATDAWPLPWYLRQYAQTGFWQPGQDPGPADFYVTTTDVPDNVQARLKSFQMEFFGVRPDVLLILWTPADKSRTPTP